MAKELCRHEPDNKKDQKNQVEWKENLKNHRKISNGKVIEFGHVLLVFLYSEIDSILFGKKEKSVVSKCAE